MLRPLGQSRRPRFPSVAFRGSRPELEGLESRVLLYAALGDQWTFDSRITYSLMPDGTNVGGVPSELFQMLNAKFPTVSWEQQIEAAASLWENVTNVNLAMVSDGGEPVGSSGDQQGDPRFGDIRIGAVPLSSSVLAVTFLPPPANGGTEAGDILLNSNVNWQINSNYDLMTVVAHEFGHALGLGESNVSTAVMYGTYNGIKQQLASDDIEGVDSIYGTRQFDQFNTGGQRDNTYTTATNINSFVKNAQAAISGLDITTQGDSEWFYVNVPASSAGTMNVTVQSSNLSLLSPKLQVYSSTLNLVGQAGTTASLGATVSVSTSVQPGQGYYIKVLAAGGPGPIGGYGLLVNFGSGPQSPIAPPATMVPEQKDGSGGTSNDNAPPPPGDGLDSLLGFFSLGNLTGWLDGYLAVPGPIGNAITAAATEIGDTANAIEVVTISIAGSSTLTLDTGLTQLLSTNTTATCGAGAAPAVVQAIDETINQDDLFGDVV